MNQPLITGHLAEQLQRFAPDTPCVVHLWVADDFDDVAPELTPGEVLATIALATPRSMPTSVSAGISCDTAPTPFLPQGRNAAEGSRPGRPFPC